MTVTCGPDIIALALGFVLGVLAMLVTLLVVEWFARSHKP